MKNESSKGQNRSKMSYFDKKRHFSNTYYIDYQSYNNFKKKREGARKGASTIHVLRPFFQVPF